MVDLPAPEDTTQGGRGLPNNCLGGIISGLEAVLRSCKDQRGKAGGSRGLGIESQETNRGHVRRRPFSLDSTILVPYDGL